MKKEKKAEETDVAEKKPSDECVSNFRFLLVDGTKYKTKVTPAFNRRKPYVPFNPNKLFSFIPGTIQKVYIAEGDKVSIGTKVLILEAMKMRNEIRSPVNGIVKKLNVKSGELVPNKHFLIEFAEE